MIERTFLYIFIPGNDSIYCTVSLKYEHAALIVVSSDSEVSIEIDHGVN